MSERLGSADTEFTGESGVVPWNWFERRAGEAFAVGGTALVASAIVPVALESVTEWSWVAGLVLVGAAVLGFAAGLLGRYPTSSRTAPRLASLGAVSAGVAGVGGLTMAAMGSLAVVAGTVGVDLGKPMGVFAAVALSMGLGLAVAFVTFGLVGRVSPGSGTVTPVLLTVGGAALLVPVVGELLRFVAGIGPPGWLLFPVLAGLAFDGLLIGYVLRRRSTGNDR